MTKNPFILRLESYTYVDITGPDTDRFLQGQMTINVNTPTTEEAFLAALCNPKGRIISLFHISKVANGYRLFMPKSIVEATVNHLKKYAVFFKTDITPGPENAALIAANKIDNSTIENHSFVKINNTELSVTCADSTLNIANIETLAQYADNEYQWFSTLATHKIAWLTDSSVEQFLPHNLNLPTLGAVDFKKGCFTGQEVIARMHYKGKLKQQIQLLRSDSEITIAPLDKLLQEEKNVAEVICNTPAYEKPCLVLALTKNIANKDTFFQLNSENTSILNLIE